MRGQRVEVDLITLHDLRPTPDAALSGLSMSRTCLRRFRLGRPPQLPIVITRRNLHGSSSRYQPVALDLSTGYHSDAGTSLSHSTDPREIVKRRKVADLVAAVEPGRRDHSYAWACYLDLLNHVTADEIPIELHQKVLRKCSDSPRRASANLVHRLSQGRKVTVPHIQEARFQAVIYNMRSAGYFPALDDYHYILRQFAAVGHHIGAMQVLRELAYVGLQRTAKTYELCLLAMVQRLSLPIWHLNRGKLVEEMTRLCMKLLKDMRDDGVPATAMNVDLALRVCKETLDLETFESTMKVAYGIDFSFPDRPPLALWGPKPAANPTSGPLAEGSASVPRPLPFSTSALNTTVDFLGRLGEVSRLVLAFEVLTTPPPSTVSIAPPSTFEDDDDDFGEANPAVAPWSPPHAEPNSTTYYFLLKWISKAGHAVLARHYLLQAMELDRKVDRALRGDCLIKPKDEILAPHFTANRSMILPIFAEANRDKNMELLRWVLVKTQRVLRRKRADLKYYSDIEEQWRQAEEASMSSVASEPEAGLDMPVEEAEEPSSSDVPSSDVPSPTDSTIPSGGSSSTPSPDPSSHTVEVTSLGLDIGIEIPPETPPPPKIFDITRHLSILSRDKEQLEFFEKHVIDIIGRNTQRVKERLGRRVWGKKNVYLTSLKGRTRLSRDVWREVVNFHPGPARPKRGGQGSDEKSSVDGVPGHTAAFRGFFTSKSYDDLVKRDEPPHLP